jgi:DNA-binding transcriptional ArsR family regulator
MVYDSPQLTAVFHALADPTRRGMLARLSQSESSISELAAPYAMSLVAASKHVRVLETAGLLTRRQEGRAQICRLQAQHLAEAMAWLQSYQAFWTTSLDQLAELLSQPDANPTPPPIKKD